jgi:predicted nucleotide-binding protein (sugar kinase/HSP70/actin superfamily)
MNNEDSDIEKELARYAEEEAKSLGLAREQWVEPIHSNSEFKVADRPHTTLLVSGLTLAHDQLVASALRGLGYKVELLDSPDNAALQFGKEFGNRGQCNPTYYTVGNLVKYLTILRDQKGLSTEDIIKNYVFFTAGSCGPCRFGMYATEYRKALRDAGFDGFRVMLFQEKGGIDQATGEESGLDLSPKFFISIVKGLLIGDVINGLGYRVRPYELEPGATDKAVEDSKQICYEAISNNKPLMPALYKVRKRMEQVATDPLRVRPLVGITGEFWAMTTEGEGNYFMQRFLEQEGAEVKIQFVTEWLLYNIWEESADLVQKQFLRQHDHASGIEEKGRFGAFKKLNLLKLAELAVRGVWKTYSTTMGYYDYHLHSVLEGKETAANFYSSELRGGEGHMEVANTIKNFVDKRTNMTLSVKPFGCMPSSAISDGVQSAVAERFPGTIFCAVETNGDGAVNFYSRIQMFLFKAQKNAEQEVESVLAETGLTMEQVREHIAKNPKFQDPLYFPKQRKKVACKTARLVYDVAEDMKTTRLERGMNTAKHLAGEAKGLASATREGWPSAANSAKIVARELGEEAMIAIGQRVPFAAKLPFVGERIARAQAQV